MSEISVKYPLRDSMGQRIRDAFPPGGVCVVAMLIGLLIPMLLLWCPMPLVIGGVVGLIACMLVVACPYVGLILFLALLYLRPEESFPQLAGLRMTLMVSVLALSAWTINALICRERFLLHLPAVRCCFGFAVVAIGSTAFSVPDLATLSDVTLEMLKLLILFLLVVHLVDSEARLRTAGGAVLLFTAIVGARTIWQYQHGEALVQSDGEVRALATGIFADPNDLALAMAMALPLALGAVLGKARAWTRLWSLATIPVLIWTIFVTNSRGGMLALGAAVFLFFGKKLGRVGIIVGALAVLLLFSFGPSRLSQLSGDDESAQGRVDAWQAGLQMLRSSPLWGVGKGQFTEHNWLTAHNSLVLCLGELGLAGTACWIGLFYFSIRDGRRVVSLPAGATDSSPLPVPAASTPPRASSPRKSIQSHSTLLQTCLVAFMVGGFFLSRTYTPPLYVYLGLTVAAAQVEGKQAGLTLPGSTGRDWANIAGITVAAVLLIVVLVRLWS
jgi:O-antigen ligase/polysaccharide polymerase Wzy-like membrane protein